MNMWIVFISVIANKIEADFGFRSSKSFDMALQFCTTLPKEELSLDKIDDYYSDLKKMIDSDEII